MRKSTTLTAVVLAASAARSQITSVDDAVFGADSITLDATQQLEFLDLPITQGLSINEMTDLLANDPAYSGFRFATADETVTLATNSGFAGDLSGFVGGTQASFGSTVNLAGGLSSLLPIVESVGATVNIPNSLRAGGFIGVPVGGSDRFGFISLNVGIDIFEQEPSFDQFIYGFGNGGEGFAGDLVSASTGHWLVRPVPAPSTATMLGVAGLAASRRRR